MATTDFSAESLLAFIDRAGAKGWLPKGTISVMKSNSKRVLSTLEAAEKADVRSIDVDEAIRRFANLNPDVSPQSLRDYRGRLEKSLRLFKEYSADPVAFRVPSGRSDSRDTVTRPARAKPRVPVTPPVAGKSESSVSTSQGQLDGSTAAMSYEYPLRSHLTITIGGVPRDLKQVEVKRLAAFLNTLAEDFQG